MSELKKIKEAVSKEREIYEPLSIDPIPMEVKNIERKMGSEKSAPLFVKMENYNNIVNSIQNLKGRLLEINELLRLKRHMSDLKKNADGILEKNIHEFISLTNKLEREFGRPRIAEPLVKEETTEQVQSFIADLDDKLKQLEYEIKRFS
jgi:hypothetical protein